MCFSSPSMPKAKPLPAEPDLDESAQTASEEEERRRKSALGSASTKKAGTMTPPATSPKSALGS